MATFKSLLPQIAILLFINTVNCVDPLVQTNVGLIKGLKATDGDYIMFLGIPYAEVDVDNSFGPSKPYPAFNKTFEAYDDSAMCPQYNVYDSGAISEGDLDCLHLHIYVPNSANMRNLLPVMVYIHGGSFYRGYATKNQSGPKYLVRHDVILVTLNYRVGAYGFMCLGTPEVPGNQGLKDQLLALRWIKSNIKSFGGNTDKITILGESAGGRSVDFHLMAEDENLFNQAVMQSGNSMSPPAVGEVNTELPIALARTLGLNTEEFREALAFLNNVDPKLVVGATDKIGWTFQACVENDLEGVERYVTDFTINRKVPKVRTTPILLGFNNNERYFAHAFKTDEDYKNLDFFGGFLRDYFTFNETVLAEAEQFVKRFYIGDEELSTYFRQAIANFDSDFTYIHPTIRRISHYLSNGAQKIYLYMFSYEGDRNYNKITNNIEVEGAMHVDELGYLFDIPSLGEPNSRDQEMIDRMTELWTNFAKYGDPTPETTDLVHIMWLPITDSNWYWFYSLDSELSLQRRPLNNRMTFLDQFFNMYEDYLYGLRKADN